MTAPFKLLDLFSGIGGFSLGLERTGGFKTVAFCEIDSFCRRVLAKHWPEVPCYHDIRELTGERLAADGIAVDAICGGFPCQDISIAGGGEGLSGDRSGLWFGYARLIGELRPQYVLVENVGALLHRGLDAVLGTLATLGYDAEWHCIQAADLGAPHIRDRVWIIAYPNRGRRRTDAAGRHYANWHDPIRGEAHSLLGAIPRPSHQWYLASADAANNHGERRGEYDRPAVTVQPVHTGLAGEVGYGDWRTPWPQFLEALCRVDDGLRGGLDKAGFAALGNAVVPQIPELIGNAILAAHREASRDAA